MSRLLPRAEVVSRIFFFRRKWSPGKCFRFCSITQNSGLHDVHSIETAIATGNASFLIYDFGRKRGRSGDRVDGRSYIQCRLVGTG